MQLARVILRAQSPDKLARFYTEHLGMSAHVEHEVLILGYSGQDALIELRQATAGDRYQHAQTDRYWKIGITLPNVDIARAQLSNAGISISEPKQFNDIGYMCHLADPEGFSIELLQHSFLGNRDATAGDPDQALGGQAAIGQITLRVTNIDNALAFYRERLGMTLLSIQPVLAYGFTLYFLAFTEERPPKPDLRAVENREWLWQRPYTTLELQHLESGLPNRPNLPGDGETGFAGIVIRGGDPAMGLLHDEADGAVYLNDMAPSHGPIT